MVKQIGERKPFKICERVYQVGGSEMTSPQDCGVYLVDGRNHLALVDSGCGPSFKNLSLNLMRLGFDPRDLDFVLLTHCHMDHVGGAALFREEYGAAIVAHRLAATPLEQGDRTMTGAFLYGLRLDPMDIDRKIERDCERLEIGDLVLVTIHSPGHSPGSICAYLDVSGTRVLFGQDIHGPFHPDFGSDIGKWRDSMERLLELEADILCEGHFGVISPSDAVRAYIESYLERFGSGPGVDSS